MNCVNKTYEQLNVRITLREIEVGAGYIFSLLRFSDGGQPRNN